MNTLELIRLFCTVDDFCKIFQRQWNQTLLHNRSSSRWWTTRASGLTLSEMMTIAIFFHSSRYRTFKDFYSSLLLKPFFPRMPSYRRFIKLLKSLIFPLFVLQQSLQGSTQGIAFIDSTALAVCHICRSSSHRVFRGIARKGKTTVGWFFGMKLHLVVNHAGELVSWMLTTGNVSDLIPAESLCQRLFGKVFGDRGYISKKLFERLYQQGVVLITRLRKNMKNVLMDSLDKALLHKRGIVESVINKLKQSCQIEHHRHRSPINFLVNLVGGLTAYSLDPNKPSLSTVWVG